MYFGKKMLRKVGNISAGAGKRKKMISRLTRKLLRRKDQLPAQLQVNYLIKWRLVRCTISLINATMICRFWNHLQNIYKKMMDLELIKDFLQKSRTCYRAFEFLEFLSVLYSWSCANTWRLRMSALDSFCFELVRFTYSN
jgi:hypothetical protein